MNEIERRKIANRFRKDEEISRLMGEAVRRALAEHKRKSNSIAFWDNGKVVILKSEDIKLGEDAKTEE